MTVLRFSSKVFMTFWVCISVWSCSEHEHWQNAWQNSQFNVSFSWVHIFKSCSTAFTQFPEALSKLASLIPPCPSRYFSHVFPNPLRGTFAIDPRGLFWLTFQCIAASSKAGLHGLRVSAFFRVQLSITPCLVWHNHVLTGTPSPFLVTYIWQSPPKLEHRHMEKQIR